METYFINKKLGRTAVVCGAGGFIGSHLVKRLKSEGYWVRGVDLLLPQFSKTEADEFIIGDLRKMSVCKKVIDKNYDEIYQLAADMGGAGYIFSGSHDADVMSNSALINLNVVRQVLKVKVKKIFYSSSACVYPSHNQSDPKTPVCSEDSVYPAAPDSEYGWEKLFSERIFQAHQRNYGIDVRIARFHNVFGPEGSWNNGKEKSIAAICRKVATAEDPGSIDIWGDGEQTRSFLYIDECLEGIRRLMAARTSLMPLNIGSEEMVTINTLAKMIIQISSKKISLKHIEGPLGVRGRCSDNKLIMKMLGWRPTQKLNEGLKPTYKWIENMVKTVAMENSLIVL